MAWECTAKAEQRKDNLIARIIREDKRLNTAEEEASSLALQVKSMQLKHEKQLKTDNCKQGKKKKITVKKVEELKKKYPCNHCHEMDHWYRECKKRLADSKNNEKKKDEAKTSETSGSAYTSDISAFYSETKDKDDNIWIADSGASMHMTSRCEYFRELGPVKTVVA